MTFKTKKAARDAGLKTKSEWMKRDYKTGRSQMIPVRQAKPVIVKNEEFFSFDNCEEIISRTEGKKRGLVLRDGVVHVRIAHADFGKSVEYKLYRRSDFRLTQ